MWQHGLVEAANTGEQRGPSMPVAAPQALQKSVGNISAVCVTTVDLPVIDILTSPIPVGV